MRVLRPIVLPESLFMWASQSETPERGGVGAQLVGDQQFRYEALLLEQLAHQPQRHSGVAAALAQPVGDLPLVVHGPPPVHPSPAIRTARRVARSSCIPALSQNRT